LWNSWGSALSSMSSVLLLRRYIRSARAIANRVLFFSFFPLFLSFCLSSSSRIFCVFEVFRMHRVSTLVVLLAFVLIQLSFSLYLSRSQHLPRSFPPTLGGSWRSDLSAVLTADRDRQACNYIVIYACYGAQPAWPVGLQRAPTDPRTAESPALSRMWI